jgi:hypothetical protein
MRTHILAKIHFVITFTCVYNFKSLIIESAMRLSTVEQGILKAIGDQRLIVGDMVSLIILPHNFETCVLKPYN